jgi:hypothetical protein
MGHSADGFGLVQTTWASQIGIEARPARAGSPCLKQGSSLPMAHRRRWPSIPVAGGTGRRENRSGITTAEWGPDLRVGGGEGLTGVALPMVARSAEGAHR